MTKTYQQADQTILDSITEIIREHHTLLDASDATFEVLFVSDIDKDGEIHQALACHGYPAAATVKIHSLPLRALGLGDFLITVDAATWASLSTAERTALLDHELCHVEAIENDGDFEHDDLGRPKLRLRKHDWQLGGFVGIAKRHHNRALEVQAVKRCKTEGGQFFWDFDVPRLAAVGS